MPRAAVKRPASAEIRHELPELELECMKVLWEAGDLTVHDVRERLHPTRPLAYTTVMTVLDRLARKSAVSRRKVGRAHIYHAEFSLDNARERALHRLLENYFGGSRELLLSHLAPGPSVSTPSPEPSTPGPQPSSQEALDETLL